MQALSLEASSVLALSALPLADSLIGTGTRPYEPPVARRTGSADPCGMPSDPDNQPLSPSTSLGGAFPDADISAPSQSHQPFMHHSVGCLIFSNERWAILLIASSSKTWNIPSAFAQATANSAV